MNRQVILRNRPTGVAQASDFEIMSSAMPIARDGELLVRNLYLSVEPAMRGWIADTGNYAVPVALGATMRALTVAEVIESRAPSFQAGELVSGWFGWQEFAAAQPDAVVRRVTETDLAPSLALGVLGINGITAHLALTRIGAPQPGETVLVTTAAGAVGSAVGQIAKIFGCRTVGIAGGPGKVEQCLTDFGYDAAIDYKAGDFEAQIAAACPDGINIFYDNTSGRISDAVYPHLALRARVVICGTSSIPSWNPWPTGPRVERHLLVKRARAEGFVIFDHADRYDASVAQLATWVRDGRLRYAEDILDGIEACPDALAGLYRGENVGKRIIRL